MASRAYEFCATQFVYDHELDFVVDVPRKMPDMLETGVFEGRAVWFLWNQTTAGENFCEKWNEHAQRARTFSAWHANSLADFEHVVQTHPGASFARPGGARERRIASRSLMYQTPVARGRPKAVRKANSGERGLKHSARRRSPEGTLHRNIDGDEGIKTPADPNRDARYIGG